MFIIRFTHKCFFRANKALLLAGKKT